MRASSLPCTCGDCRATGCDPDCLACLHTCADDGHECPGPGCDADCPACTELRAATLPCLCGPDHDCRSLDCDALCPACSGADWYEPAPTLPLCPDCIDHIGGAFAGPDADWRPCGPGEACGAVDHGGRGL